MIEIAWYLAKVTICSAILLGYYWLALRNKAFHQYNRFYLLFIVILSILLPFVQINFWHSNTEPTNAIKVIEAVSYGNTYVNDIVINSAPLQKTFNWQMLYPIFYILISLVLSIGFIKMLFQIRTLLKKYPTQKIEEVTFVNTDDEKGTPFSFLKYIFWNNKINTSTAQGNQIFKHELAHINEKHTYDKLFINIVLIVFWCNPFFWLLRKEINLLHEFIADKKAVEDGDTSAFAAMLLQTIYPQHQFSIANNFFYSPIKRRLLMLTKIKNPKANYIGRILVLPLAVLLLAAFTFKVNKHTNLLYTGKKITVVIDAGHGGEKDLGATSLDGTTEKELNLALAKRIKEINTNSNIEIVLTRETDVYQSPQEKADFANNLGADLLIAVHIDKDPKPIGDIKSGMNIFVAKNECKNASLSKAFGAYMLQSFTSNYKLPVPSSTMQRSVGIWIINGSNCPSILVEAGFINNEKDLAYLKSNEGQTQFAKNILAGVENFLAQPPLITTHTDTIPNKLPTKAQWEKAANQKPTNDLKPTSSVTISALNGKIDFYGDKKTTIQTNDNPLFVLDGVEISKSELDKLDPSTIESIDVLKGENVPTYYGEKGKNGVVKITTKNKSIIRLNSPAGVTNPKSSIVPDMLYIVNGLQVNKEEVGKIKTDDIIDVRVIQAKDAIPTYGDKAQNGVMIFNVKEQKNIVVETIDLDADAKNVGKNPYVELDGKPFNDEFKTIPKQILKSIKIIGKNEAVKIYGDKAKEGAILVTTK
jgi:N-acetylmuramoyl-L-alanine amidase